MRSARRRGANEILQVRARLSGHTLEERAVSVGVCARTAARSNELAPDTAPRRVGLALHAFNMRVH